MKAIISLLSLCGLIAAVTPTALSSNLNQAAFYRDNRQLVNIEITQPDNTVLTISAPFLSIELEQNVYTGNAPLVGISAQITTSAVTNFTSADLICILYSEVLVPLAFITTNLQSITTNASGAAIYSVGCGTLNTIATTSLREREVGLAKRCTADPVDGGTPPPSCFNGIWTCIFSVLTMCWCVAPSGACN